MADKAKAKTPSAKTPSIKSPSAPRTPAENKTPGGPPAAGTGQTDDGAQMTKKKKGGSKCKAFKTFLYNPADKTIIGHTGWGWLKILIFYVIFYLMILAFFFMLIFVFFQFTDENKPILIGGNSYGDLIGAQPGLGFRPQNIKEEGSSLIWFSRSKHEAYTDELNKTMEAVSDKPSIPEACKGGDFGYRTGSPCVMIRVNRIYGWEPKADIEIECFGKEPIDRTLVGQVKIEPKKIPGSAFPYKGPTTLNKTKDKDGKTKKSPPTFVMVQFMNPTPGVLIRIRCQADSKSIPVKEEDRKKTLAGTMDFELMVDP